MKQNRLISIAAILSSFVIALACYDTNTTTCPTVQIPRCPNGPSWVTQVYCYSNDSKYGYKTVNWEAWQHLTSEHTGMCKNPICDGYQDGTLVDCNPLYLHQIPMASYKYKLPVYGNDHDCPGGQGSSGG